MQLVSIKSLEISWSFRKAERLCQVTGYSRSSAMEQAMCSGSKARLVCGGNHQIEGIDYQATYAPTARLGHVRLALAIAAKYDLEIHQMDVCTAFLGVDLEQEIYMHTLQGYFRLLQNWSQHNNPRLTKTLRKMVLRLR